MLIGAIIASTGPLPCNGGLQEMARTAEEAGANSLWVSDHLVSVAGDVGGYPYTVDGQQPWSNEIDVYEAFVCCSVLATVTAKARIGIATLVLPQRNVLEVAKQAASLDRLSGGRFVLGVGAGWYSAEMEALGYNFSTRAARLDEGLRVLRDCWSGRPKSYDGTEIKVRPGLILNPRPARASGPPLLVGGMTPPALRRAVTLGDGWVALAYLGRLDVESLAGKVKAMKAMRARADEERPFITVLKLHCTVAEAWRLPEVVSEIETAGFDELIIDPPWELGTEVARDVIARVCAAGKAQNAVD